MSGRGKPANQNSMRPAAGRLQEPDLALLGPLDIPELPDEVDWLPETRDWWLSYWTSEVARATIESTDERTIVRLAWLYDERERNGRALRKMDSPFTTGSQGQLVPHPITKYISGLDSEIRQLEDRLGLNPRARIALGIELAKARRGLKDLYGPKGDGKAEKRDEDGEAKLELVDGSDLG